MTMDIFKLEDKFCDQYLSELCKLTEGTDYNAEIAVTLMSTLDDELKGIYHHDSAKKDLNPLWCFSINILAPSKYAWPFPPPKEKHNVPFLPPPNDLLVRIRKELPQEYEGLPVRVVFTGLKKRFFGLSVQPYSIEV